MRSAKLAVLLTATPITELTAPTAPTSQSQQRPRQWSSNSQIPHQSANEPPENDGNHLVHYHHESVNNRTQTTVSNNLVSNNLVSNNLEIAEPQPYDVAVAAEYRVGLTFDEQAIAVFIDHTKDRANHSPTLQQASHNEKLMAQEAFVLNWSKRLATSPEGDSQSGQLKLDNQLQQSLLLDQVITRIRHSLDLSAILETTVAQVREFLGADRLVLYQFDHFNQFDDQIESIESPSPFDRLTTPAYRSAVNSTAAHSTQAHSAVNPAFNSAKTGQAAANSILGQCLHSGHVTYEARASADISSVLHLSEKECFEPSLSLRARYLMGRPIAINNVDQQYAGITCLLNFLQQAQIKSKIIAPIIVQDELWGLLIAHQCDDYRQWQATEAVFLQHIAEHLAVAISQASHIIKHV
ncbi:MAG: GAF domain-containing protein, partial [Phormidesmis sp. RL_2_1]|nr:GAF domain-containing protein [Phormidesmis sp. RL_2_1]